MKNIFAFITFGYLLICANLIVSPFAEASDYPNEINVHTYGGIEFYDEMNNQEVDHKSDSYLPNTGGKLEYYLIIIGIGLCLLIIYFYKNLITNKEK